MTKAEMAQDLYRIADNLTLIEEASDYEYTIHDMNATVFEIMEIFASEAK